MFIALWYFAHYFLYDFVFSIFWLLFQLLLPNWVGLYRVDTRKTHILTAYLRLSIISFALSTLLISIQFTCVQKIDFKIMDYNTKKAYIFIVTGILRSEYTLDHNLSWNQDFLGLLWIEYDYMSQISIVEIRQNLKTYIYINCYFQLSHLYVSFNYVKIFKHA